MDNAVTHVVHDAEKGSHSPFERASYYILLGLVFFLPLFFLPSVSYPVDAIKTFLFVSATVVCFCLWLIDCLRSGKVSFPTSPLFIAAAAVPAATLVSALFSPTVGFSLLGRGAEIDTFAAVLVGFVAFFVTSSIFTKRNRIFYFYISLLASFLIITLFHLLRLMFGPSFLSIGLFTAATDNLVGKWNDLGIYAGLALILSLITLEFLKLNKTLRIWISVALGLSLIIVAAVNFFTLWIVVGLFAFVSSVYLVSFHIGKNARAEGHGAMKLPIASITVLVFSIIFLLASAPISDFIANSLHITQVEVRPSFSATMQLASQTLKTHAIFGSGPSRFLPEWLTYKPQEINNTIFWNSEFNFGVGLIPTFLITTGLLGIIAWLAFLGYFLFVGFKAILAPIEDVFSRYLVVSSFFASLYLWIFSVIYIPSVVTWGLTFLMTGVFAGALVEAKLMKTKTVSFASTPRVGFAYVLVLIVILIGSVTFEYVSFQRVSAATSFQMGQNAAIAGNVDVAEADVAKAALTVGSDAYYRALVQIDLVRLQDVYNQSTQKDASRDAVLKAFQQVFGTAVANATAAEKADPTNYQNWISLGQVYGSVVPLHIQGAYENALANFKVAVTLNPQNPTINLSLAQLEVANGSNDKAVDYINRALAQKSDYVDAIFLLSQIQVDQGKIKPAIASLEAATLISPNDYGLEFQLGLLRYNDKNYQGAVDALERAVALLPNFANAKYFLGLSYDKLGRKPEAITQFTDVLKLNPDSQDVKNILANLAAGKAALATTAPAKAPEKAKHPPVTDQNTGSTP